MFQTIRNLVASATGLFAPTEAERRASYYGSALGTPPDLKVSVSDTAYSLHVNRKWSLPQLEASLDFASRILMAERPNWPLSIHERAEADAYSNYHGKPRPQDISDEVKERVASRYTEVHDFPNSATTVATGIGVKADLAGNKDLRLSMTKDHMFFWKEQPSPDMLMKTLIRASDHVLAAVMGRYPLVSNATLMKAQTSFVSKSVSDLWTVAPAVMRKVEKDIDLPVYSELVAKMRASFGEYCVQAGLPMPTAHNPAIGLGKAGFAVKQAKTGDKRTRRLQEQITQTTDQLGRLMFRQSELQRVIPEIAQRLPDMRLANTELVGLLKFMKAEGGTIKPSDLADYHTLRPTALAPYQQDTAPVSPDGTLSIKALQERLSGVQQELAGAQKTATPFEGRYGQLYAEEERIARRNADLLKLIEAEIEKKSRETEAATRDAKRPAQEKVPAIVTPETQETGFGETYKDAAGALYVKWKLAGQVATVPLPKTFDGIQKWAEQNLGDYAVLASGAAKEMSASLYRDKPQGYKALLMAASFADMSRGGPLQPDTRQFFLDMERKLGFEVALSASRSVRRNFKSDYEALYDGKRYDLDRSVKYGDEFDPTRTMRLYFTYDSANRATVIGGGFAHRKGGHDM